MFETYILFFFFFFLLRVTQTYTRYTKSRIYHSHTQSLTQTHTRTNSLRECLLSSWASELQEWVPQKPPE